MATKLNKLLTGHTITDELFTRTGSTALGLEHDTIRGTTDLEIWTGAGKTGTKLTITTDYTVSDEDTVLSTESGVTIYTKVAIVNGTYQNVSLYANYKTIGDYNDADDINYNKYTQTITANYTALISDKTILVNTDNAVTVSVTSGLPIGFELEVQRVSSGLTTNAVTLSFTGETIYTAATIALFGNSVAKTTKFTERFVIRKITSTTWELVAGEDAGINTNGTYRASYDRTARCDNQVSCAMTLSLSNWFGTSSGTSYYGASIVTFAKGFTTVKSVITTNIDGSISRVQNLTNSGCTIQGFNNPSTTGNISYSAFGIWL